MFHKLTGIGLALALVGSAHAQDAQLTVKLDGKSPRAVRTELYHAAEKVCAQYATAFESTDMTCVEATYSDALQQLRATAHVERTAYNTGLR